MKNRSKLVSCVAAICRFPRMYKSGANLPPKQIFQESGYSTHRDRVTQALIEEELRGEASLVQDWICWSSDKRWAPAWGLSDDAGMWQIYRVERDGSRVFDLLFDDPIQACALMVRLDMEDLQRLEDQRKKREKKKRARTF